MKTFGGIALSLAAMLGIVALVAATSRVGAKSIRLNTRDLSEHQLRLVAPTDSSFDASIAKLGVNLGENEQLIAVTKPFSVVVRNESSKDVIAYRLRWDVLQPDGSVTTHLRTYAEPGSLMGGYSSRRTANNENAGLAIAASSEQYVSVVTPIGKSQAVQAITASTGGTGSITDVSRLQQLGSEKNESALIDLLAAELSQSESLTVTLDVAVFDDGTVVGPDSFNYFDELSSEIAAKYDLLRDALTTAQQNRPLEQVFKNAESIAKDTDALDIRINGNSRSSDYYRFYKAEFAKELVRMRESSRDDKTTVWRATRALYRNWPKLHKKS